MNHPPKKLFQKTPKFEKTVSQARFLKIGYLTTSLSRIKYRDRGLFADISQNDIFGKETVNEKVYS